MSTLSARELIKQRQAQYQTSGADWFKLADDGDSALVRFLEGDEEDLLNLIIPVHEIETAPGKKIKVRCTETSTCPLCNSGNRPQLKVFLYLVDGRDGKVKVWERPNGFISVVLAQIEENGPLNNRQYKIVRNGAKGNTKTTYTFFAKDKDLEGVAALPERPDVYAGLVKKLDEEAMKKALVSGEWGGGAVSREAGTPVPESGAPGAGGKRLKF